LQGKEIAQSFLGNVLNKRLPSVTGGKVYLGAGVRGEHRDSGVVSSKPSVSSVHEEEKKRESIT